MKLFSRRFLFSFIILIAISQIVLAANLLKNGNFEGGISNRIPKSWGTEYYNCSIVPGFKGKAIKISNLNPRMSLGAQEIKLDWKKTPKVSLSARVKIENVILGEEDWNQANLQLLFFDAKGAQLGGWPELGKWSGTFDWKRAGKNFVVPKGTVKAKVIIGLFNCSGTVYFDDVSLEPFADQKSTDPYNLIENGGFELWDKWAYGGSNDWGIIFDSVKEGNGALWIKNNLPIWSFASQSVPLDGARIKRILISGYVRSKDVVPGVKPWQLARVNIEFKDGKGKRIGGYPILEAFSGTFDWRKSEKIFDVPPGTKRVDVFAGLLECSGEAWFDGLKLKAFDASEKIVKAGGYSVTDTKGWYPFKPGLDKFESSAIDASPFIEKPAGKHGFMAVKDGHFYFEDGTRARFWGTNIYAPSTFPSKKDAETMAKRISKYGYNLVRLHHLDAFWSNPNIFDPNFNDTQHLSADSLDKLDYLIFKLKQNGVYVFMDLLVDREFKEGDNVVDFKNVERGAKITGFFNPRIIELQKIYANQLLTHQNPYTGLRYVDDPAIISAKLINEAMLFYIGTQFGLSQHYVGELDQLFNTWLLAKYGNRDSLAKAWTDEYGRSDLQPEEDLKTGGVKRADTPLRYQRSGGERREPLRLSDTLKFYEKVQTDYFKDMEKYLRSIGVRVPISGSNHWVNVAADVKSNSELDYIDRHRYWDHPQFGYGTRIVFEDQSMLLNPADALPNNFAFYKVKGKPFVISEWNCAFPNEYRVEGPLVMAAYAALQDWDAVLQFSFNHPNWTAPMEDNFDVSAWPSVMSQLPAAAALFYRKDVSVAVNTIEANIGDKDLYGLIDEDMPLYGKPFLPLISRTEVNFNGSSAGAPGELEAKYSFPQSKEISSDTSELKWNYGKGIFTIDTQKTQAVVGFISGGIASLKDVEIKSDNKFASIALTSLDYLPLSSSARVLLTAGARIENKGQRYNVSRTQLETVGAPPIIVEGVKAKITFKRQPKAVTALDIHGKTVKKINVSGNGFDILPEDKAFFYDIVF
ncbi:hypothetical protein HZC34_00010 [Candidatus Saganbacteria bacterium]|nr:hypothetical protein [Candidatus Saganbacteria bacterium]